MIRKLFHLLLGRRQPVRVLRLPDLCGSKLELGEVVAALHGAGKDPKVRALLQVLWMRREACDEAAVHEAHHRLDNSFQMGGRTAIDDALADLQGLLEKGLTDDEMKSFFRDA